MKNTIKMNRTNEINAKKAAEEAAAKAAKLNNIKPKNIVETLKDLEKESAKVLRDEAGNAIGVYNGKYVHKLVKGSMIAAETEDGLKEIEARMAKGINGDQLLHKVITVNGNKIECVGKTEEEIKADEEAAEIYSREHPVHFMRDLDLAEQLKEADIKAESLEQINVKGADFLLVYDGNYVMDLTGVTVADKNGKKVNLDDLKSKLSREDAKIILLERLEKALDSKRPATTTVPVASAPKHATKRAPKATGNVQVTVCSMLLCRTLREITIDEIIRIVLNNQKYCKGDYCGYKDTVYITAVEEHLSANALANPTGRTIIEPTTQFILENIALNSPVEANSIDELIDKVKAIVYNALKDEPYFGMSPSQGAQLAKMMAIEIVNHSIISYK